MGETITIMVEEQNDYVGMSKINSAMIVNITTNNLWIDFFRNFRDGRYLAANNDLDCIWTVLGGDVEEESVEDKTYFSIESDLKDSGSLQDGIKTKGFSPVDENDYMKFSKQKAILLKKSLFLRRLQNKQGKGTAYDTGESEYMDG